MDLQLAVEFLQSFTHPWDTHAQAARLAVHYGNNVGCDPVSVVLDLQTDILANRRYANSSSFCSRIAVHIGKAFLHDAEERRLDVRRETRQIPWDIYFHMDSAAVAEALRIPTYRRR